MKQLIDCVTTGGKSLFIDADTVVAFEEDTKNSIKVYCKGVQEPFLVACSPMDIYVKLTKLKVAELVKPEPSKYKKAPANPN